MHLDSESLSKSLHAKRVREFSQGFDLHATRDEFGSGIGETAMCRLQHRKDSQ